MSEDFTASCSNSGCIPLTIEPNRKSTFSSGSTKRGSGLPAHTVEEPKTDTSLANEDRSRFVGIHYKGLLDVGRITRPWTNACHEKSALTMTE